jgi:erythronate-4-phosphate dehydrogenase
VVETEALKKAIRDHHLSDAVLDVWEKEPNINASLLELVTLGTPHIAGYSLDGKVNALAMNYEAVCKFLNVPVEQDVHDYISGPKLNEIEIKDIKASKEVILRDIVKRCYDINLDDKNLRGIKDVPESEIGRYFQKLRAEYRIRREFSNSSVMIPEDQKELIKTLKLLGFKLNGKS